MEIINDQHNTVVESDGIEAIPPKPVRSEDLGSPDHTPAARAGSLTIDESGKSPASASAHYSEMDLGIKASRIRDMLEKARGVFGDAIGSAVAKSREFLSPKSRKVAVAGGIGALAAGTAIRRVRSHT